MDAESAVPAVADEQKQANKASLVRAGIICAVWLATWTLRHISGEVRLGLDLLLVLAGIWAMQPGRRAGGKIFGEHGHWSSLVVALPIGFGIAAAAELWHLIRGG